MTGHARLTRVASWLVIASMALVPVVGCHAPTARLSEDLVIYGSMHETIGMRQHQGRVRLDGVVDNPRFYGVGALEGLEGEITILDSAAVVTGVDETGRPQPLAPAGREAALLVGQSAEEWTRITVDEDVSPEQFDDYVGKMAAKATPQGSGPFVFTLEGQFTDVRLHVINGACPIRARMKKQELSRDQAPYELEAAMVGGTVVGVYAEDSVGKLTHPATRTHAHLIYVDQESGERVTGHLERIGLTRGSILQIPAHAHTKPQP